VTVQGQEYLSDRSAIHSYDHEGVAGANKTFRRFGNLVRDTVVYHGAVAAEEVEVLGGAGVVRSSEKYILIDGVTTPTVRAYVKVSNDYNGSPPVLKRGRDITLDLDTVVTLATHSGGATWELLSGLLTCDYRGVLECFVEGDGSVGSFYVDDWSVV
jgi:hypothetical protein